MNRSISASIAGVAMLALLPLTLHAQRSDQEKIEEALAAAPPGLAEGAAVMDWPAEEGGDFTLLREGSNGWTCLPDPPGDENFEPMCNDDTWMAWVRAMVAGQAPEIDEVGLSYMLSAKWAVSNIDPEATEPTPDNEWVEGGPHMMMIVPDPAMLAHYPDEPSPTRPYVMWKGTPYVHVMIPLEEVAARGQ